MKPEKREEARRLRREEGLPITEICRRLGVAKGSVSLWVRDIELTPAQQEELHRQHYAYRAQLRGGATNSRKFRELRRQYQEEGRAKARERDPLHVAGCMLYWGEGRKQKNSLALVNSDVDLLRHFMLFLRDILGINDETVFIRVSCYLGNGLTQAEIEDYWLDSLELPRICLKQTIVNVQPLSSRQKGKKLFYGTCEIAVHNTRVVQHVFGAIQEYAGIDKPEWLM